MRIATLRFISPFKAPGQALPETLFRGTSGGNIPSAAPQGPAVGRTAVLGLLLLGLGACQPGSDAESAADAAGSAASEAAGAASETASEAVKTVAASATGSGDSAQADSQQGSGGAAGLDSDQQKASYAMGYGLTGQATGQFYDAIDHEAFVAGVRAQLEGRDSEVTQQDAQRAVAALTDTQKAKQALAATTAAKEGAKFLADNASAEGVVTTSTGLQYMVLEQGEGAKPSATDTVKTHYQGTLINGDVFDSSIARGEPATFPLNGVIPGWTEALQLMNTGSKYRLFIPPELAYGNRATGSIPPQSTLIFEVELIEILGGDAS